MDLQNYFPFSLERKQIVATLAFILSIIGFFFFFRALFFLVFLILLNLGGGFVLSRQRMVLNMFGFEFVTFSTILAAFAFGPVIGASMGVICRLCEAISMKHNFSLAVTLPLYAGLGIIAGTVHPGNLVSAGIIMAIVFSIIGSLLTYIFLSGRPFTMVVFTATQIAFSFVLISYLFPIAFTLLRI